VFRVHLTKSTSKNIFLFVAFFFPNQNSFYTKNRKTNKNKKQKQKPNQTKPKQNKKQIKSRTKKNKRILKKNQANNLRNKTNNQVFFFLRKRSDCHEQ